MGYKNDDEMVWYAAWGRGTLIAGVGMGLLMQGCARQAQPMAAREWVPEAFSTQPSAAIPSEPLPEKWWLSLNDPALNVLMEEALGQNFTIRSAWDRLTQAEQLLRQANAALIPSVTYHGGVRRSRTETDTRTSYQGTVSAGVSVSYELDLWGKWRSTKQALQFDAEARQEDVASAAMTVSAGVARTWYQLTEANLQVDVIGRQLQTNRDVLQIVTLSFRQGKVGAADVFRQRQLMEASEGQLIQAQERVAVLQHGLAVLVGRAPGGWQDRQPHVLLDLPPLPATGLPSEVLTRRPDIRRAFRAIQATDQRVAVAVADRYPSVDISAGLETGGNGVEDLFQSWSGNLAANLVGPLYDAGRRQAEVARQEAILSQAINEYSQQVLVALQEVEDALAQEDHQHAYVASVQQQLATARLVLERIRQNYFGGQLDYLRVLDSLSSLQALERNELSARRTLIERRIDLCRAIAGSWEMERPEQAKML